MAEENSSSTCATRLTVSDEDFLLSMALLALIQLLLLLLFLSTKILASRTKTRTLETIEGELVRFLFLSQQRRGRCFETPLLNVVSSPRLIVDWSILFP